MLIILISECFLKCIIVQKVCFLKYKWLFVLMRLIAFTVRLDRLLMLVREVAAMRVCCGDHKHTNTTCERKILNVVLSWACAVKVAADGRK